MIPVPGLAALFRLRARRAARAKDWPRAVRLRRQMLALNLGGARDRVQLAHALKGAGDIAAAEAEYRAAAAAFPLVLDAQRQLGLFLRHHGSANEAVDVLARALALAPSATDIRAELDDLGFGGAALDERMIAGLLGGSGVSDWWPLGRHDPRKRPRDDDAVAAFRQALIRRPRDPALYVGLGEALLTAGNRRAGTQALLAAWRLQPGRPDAAAALAALGWSVDDRARLTASSWGHADPAAPEGLTPRERTIWTHLAHGVGYLD